MGSDLRRDAAPWVADAAPWVAAVALLMTLSLAYLGKAVCLDGETGFWAMTRYCYSDVRVLWGLRGFDVDAVPYAPPPPDYVEDYTLEYPPGTVFPAYLVALVTDSQRSFFVVHALTFAAAALATLWALDRILRPAGRSRWRLLGFALSPGLVLFGMQNWDLWSVAPAALGLAAAARGRTGRAGAWLGVGTAVKWWPALLLVPVVVGPWSRAGRDDRAAPRLRVAGVDLRPALIAGAVWAAIQAPAVAIGPQRWWTALRFHLTRPANLDSLASTLSRWGGELAPGLFWGGSFTVLWTIASLSLLAAAGLYLGSRLRDRTIAPGDAALALVALFLLTSKVLSPQFILWLVPIAVIARVPWTPVLAVEAANAAVWILYGPWMAHIEDPSFGGFLRAAQAMTLVRAAALVWLLAVALWPLPRPEDAEQEQRERADARQEP